MPLELQAKLLRVLQEGEFERLGSPRTIKVDVRVIASTSRDLKAEICNRRFREDLFYRLNVFPFSIPPLRLRAEDIPQLVHYFVDKYARKFSRKYESVPKSTMKALQEHPWPGNVRELEHVIERAVISSPGPMLRVVDGLEREPAEAGEEPLKALSERWSGGTSSRSSKKPAGRSLAKAAPPPSSDFTRARFGSGSRSWV